MCNQRDFVSVGRHVVWDPTRGYSSKFYTGMLWFKDITKPLNPVSVISQKKKQSDLHYERCLTNLLFLLFSSLFCPFVSYCFTTTVSSTPSRSWEMVKKQGKLQRSKQTGCDLCSLHCRHILGAWVHILVLGRHLGFSNCGGLGRGDIHWEISTPNHSQNPYPTSAPTLYRSSIQLQSKMVASNQFI